MRQFLCIILLLLLFLGCRREGQTGEITLVVSPIYLKKPVSGTSVFVRYGATELQGTSPSDFDLAAEVDSSSSNVVVKSLRKGDYYVYCIVYNDSLASFITGGAHVKLTGKKGEKGLEIELTD